MALALSLAVLLGGLSGVPAPLGGGVAPVMRPATLEDSAFFLELRNDPEARRWSRNADIVTSEVHATWFPKALARQQCYVEPMAGVVRVATDGEISVIVAPQFRGHGVGSSLVFTAMMYAGQAQYLATVHRQHTRSLLLFLRLGFIPTAVEGEFVSFVRAAPSPAEYERWRLEHPRG